MCGIVGVFNLNEKNVSRVILNKMNEKLLHRGPDSGGTYIENNIGFGHRRLSIIDLSTLAQQPMISRDKNYVLTYNGEIYNFLEIRAELESLGYEFVSNSDTEVLLYSFIEWKEKCVDKINGMFAFAIFDKKNEKLFLARDRYGIKPLYYAKIQNEFVFSSEHKAILEHPGFKKKFDYEALYEYFTFQNIFTNKTFFSDIKLFPPGSFAFINRSGKMKITKYWDYNFIENEEKISENEYKEELDRLFCQAVNRQLLSDVEVGSYLSGGMDSGSITAIASKQLPYIKTFTCGFDLNSASGIELGFDERSMAEYMSYLFKTEHYEMVLKSGDMERIMGDMAWHVEEPRVGQSYPNYYAAKLASKFVKVVLSGAGGDELFGGYPWRYYRAVNNNNFDDYISKYYSFWQRLIPDDTINKVFSPVLKKVNHINTRSIFKNVFQDHHMKLNKPEDYINHSLYFEAKTFMHGLLIIEDKLSMAHSLETRVPFLDNDLVDFTMKIPVKLKLKNLKNVINFNENETGLKTNKYFKKTRDGKLILREVMKKYIPEKITKAAKQGFSAPDASWFKGESIDYVKNIIMNNNSLIYNFFDRKIINDLVGQHMDGKCNRRLFIWSLINFEKFLENYF